MTPVRLEPAAPQPRVKHSTPEPLRSPVCPAGVMHVLMHDEVTWRLQPILTWTLRGGGGGGG